MVNLIFALWIVFMPIVQSFSDLIGISENLFGELLWIPYQIFIFTFAYLIYLVIKFVFLQDKKKGIINLFRNKNKILIILSTGLILSIIISSCISGFTPYVFVYFGYLMMFICVYNLPKAQIQIILKIMMIVVGISCVLGFLDPCGDFVPGFSSVSYPTSIHFWNPNYAGYVVAVCIMLVIMHLKKAKDLKDYIHYGLLFCIYAIYLYFNGSFVPITAVFVTLFLLIVFHWIREKKFQKVLSMLFILLVPFAFIVDAIPNINKYRSSHVNYFVECIAVVDNIIGTSILDNISDLDTVEGAYGWNRDDLIEDSINAVKPCKENNGFMRLLFGYGAGYASNLRPHNNYIWILVDLGLFTVIFYILLIIYYFIIFIKSKKNSINITFTAIMILFFLMSFFSSIIDYWYWQFVICYAIGFTSMKRGFDADKNKDCKK